MEYHQHAGRRLAWAGLVLLLIIPGALGFTASPVTITPSGPLFPGNPVNITSTVYAASGVAFPSYDDLQFVTELDDPVWSYTVIVNGIENVRPAERGKILTISGFELAYQNKDEVIVKSTLRAKVPASAPVGAPMLFMKIQELDARSNVIPYSVIQADHLVGEPTPTPTPAYGSITVVSEPESATVYVDNVIKGISPLTLDSVPNGHHTVLLRLEGYQDYEETVTVMADARQVSATMAGAASTPVVTAVQTHGTGTTPVVTATQATAHPTQSQAMGTLVVITEPAGALVYIDNELKGISPATIPGLSAGTHSVTLIMDGYLDFRTTTEIVPGTTSEFVTGLAKRKTVPGFTFCGAVAALGVLCVSLAYARRRGQA